MIEQLYNSYPTDYRLQDLLQTFSFSNPHIGFVLTVAGITFLMGYLEYMYSFALVLWEKSAPFPIWMHTFYFAHDSTGAIVFALAALANNNFWFFWSASGALMVWNLFEIFNLYKAITVERNEIWGHLYPNGQVTVGQAFWKVVVQIIMMIAIVNLFRVFMHDPYMFKWFIFTNVIMAIFPGLYWEQRKTQTGGSMGLAIVIFICTVNSFIPMNMWALSSHYFSMAANPWFYLIGIVSIAYSIRSLLKYRQLPAKPQLFNGKKRIW